MKIRSVEVARTVFRPDKLLFDDRPQVAFGGRSNVGKSSLINRMLGRKKLARTSSSPGRTRSINYFLINERFYFVDLPGYGYAKASHGDREAWARLVQSYLTRSSEAAVRSGAGRTRFVLLVDGKIGGSPLDAEAASYLAGFEIDLTVAVTKIDRVSRNQRSRRLAEVAGLLHLPESAPMIPVSANTGEGLSQLWSELFLT